MFHREFGSGVVYSVIYQEVCYVVICRTEFQSVRSFFPADPAEVFHWQLRVWDAGLPRAEIFSCMKVSCNYAFTEREKRTAGRQSVNKCVKQSVS